MPFLRGKSYKGRIAPEASGRGVRRIPHRPEKSTAGGTQPRRPEERRPRRRHTPGAPTDTACAPASDRGSRFLESIRSSPRAALVRAPGITASVPQAGVRHRRSVHPPQKKKASRDPATPCTPPSTPPNANRAPRAGPPRGCAPWQRGARGQGSSRGARCYASTSPRRSPARQCRGRAA